MSDLCPHGIDIEVVWTPADPPNCQSCFDSLAADLDELELNDPAVRDAAITLADVLDRYKPADIFDPYDLPPRPDSR